MEIEIVDDLAPEAVAMVQALYSRSPRSVKEHLAQVRERGAEKFMSQFYVGYGHKSIGDCGTTSVFIEGVSLLAAKAIQDSALYNGQEASTRYLDMSSREIRNPLADDRGQAILQRWMNLYALVLRDLVPYFKERFPRHPDEKERTWETAINAKAFDVARGFLPAGVTTNVAWHTTLSHAHEHLSWMAKHPLVEIRAVAQYVLTALRTRYPSSFGHVVSDLAEQYHDRSMMEFAYDHQKPIGSFYTDTRLMDISSLADHRALLETRPPRTPLHPRFRRFGALRFSFMLDFGSYRDLQRHRSVVQDMPLLTTHHGIHSWYLEQLPDSLRGVAEDTCMIQEGAIAALRDAMSPEAAQYYTAIGYRVGVNLTAPLPAVVYIAELRSGQTVHPTLRTVAQQMGDMLKSLIPYMAMHHDTSPDMWSVKRGRQDIVKVDR